MTNPATPQPLALAFCSDEESGTHPVSERHPGPFGSSRERGVFVAARTEAFDVGARVVESGSAELCHALRIAATESLDNGEICGHNKDMANDTLTGITKAAGTCADCARELTIQVFTVRDAEGNERDLGRRCAVKATGWKRPEDAARTAARTAVTTARIAALTAEGMDAAHAAIYAADAWWTGRTAAEVAECWRAAA